MSKHAGTASRYPIALQRRVFDEVRGLISGGESESMRAMKRMQRAMRPQASTQSSREFPATFLRPKSPSHGEKGMRWDPVRQAGILICELTSRVRCHPGLIGCRGQTWNPTTAPIRSLKLSLLCSLSMNIYSESLVLNPRRPTQPQRKPARPRPSARRSPVLPGCTWRRACQQRS